MYANINSIPRCFTSHAFGCSCKHVFPCNSCVANVLLGHQPRILILLPLASSTGYFSVPPEYTELGFCFTRKNLTTVYSGTFRGLSEINGPRIISADRWFCGRAPCLRLSYSTNVNPVVTLLPNLDNHILILDVFRNNIVDPTRRGTTWWLDARWCHYDPHSTSIGTLHVLKTTGQARFVL